MKEIYGIYRGIVVQNNDPKQMGRAKVFVPGVSNTVYDNWNEIPRDKEFSGIDGDLIKILDQLKEDLPWANQAESLFGGDNDRAYYANGNHSFNRPSDGKNPTDSFNNQTYEPADYSNTCGGTFTIPAVGSHVYLFFLGGNQKCPIYFAVARDREDWNNVYKDNYPTDTSPYSNKHILNTLKHSIEMVDTDNSEEINISHYSGSNIQMLNDYMSRYSVKNDYTLVEEDQYLTVNGNSKTEIGKQKDETIKGDLHLTIEDDLIKVISGTKSETVGGNSTLKVDGNLTIEASKITLKVDSGNQIEITPFGVNIDGVKIDLN